ncbi:MAG: DoxX family protein [Propionibacteriaceae bacterium]|jgi:uncharacterized membrane protein YphA (DoxX/SURF4 family)|nr:DoxX family protein [Propionibacteriaceae bacterium]
MSEQEEPQQASEDWTLPENETTTETQPDLRDQWKTPEDQWKIPEDTTVEQPANSPIDGIFRDSTMSAPLTAEEASLQAERSARKEARLQALNTAPIPAVTVPAEPVAAPAPVKRTTDKFLPSLGLFLLRIVVAGILGIRAVQWLAATDKSTATLAHTIIPPEWHGLAVIIAGVAMLLIAFSLIVGLLTRVAGFGLAALVGCALALVEWGPYTIFQAQNWPGFLGELELLLAAIGIAILCVGAGGWSLDYSFRSRRVKAKQARETIG